MVISKSIPFKITCCCLVILHLEGTLVQVSGSGSGSGPGESKSVRSFWRKWNLSSLSSDKFLSDVGGSTNDMESESDVSMDMGMQIETGMEKKIKESMSNSSGYNKNSGECGRNLTNLKEGDAGMIQSPNYPHFYPDGLNCQWILETDAENQIEMTVFDIRIKSPSFIGEQDNLLVALNKNLEFAQSYSGDLNSGTPFNLLSESNRVALTFHSTLTTKGSNGFKIGYYIRKRGQKPSITESLGPVLPPVAAVCDASPTDLPRSRNSYSDSFIRTRFQAIRRLQRVNPNPHLVALVLDDKHFCSGTLIRDNFVMTSAHCTQNVEKIEMIFGTFDITLKDAGVQKRYVNSSSVYQHPFFDMTTGSHDVSLIRLSRPIMFTRFVKAARLPQWSNLGIVLNNGNFQVSGWGDSKDGSVYAKSRGMEVTVLPNAACRSSIHKGLNGLMMCTKGKSDSSSAAPTFSSTCQVDSGSPIISRCKENGVYKPNQCYTAKHNPLRVQVRDDRCFLKYYLPQLFSKRSEQEINDLLHEDNDVEFSLKRMLRNLNSSSNSTENVNVNGTTAGKPNKGNRPQKPHQNQNQNHQNNRPSKPSQNQNHQNRPQKPSNGHRPQKPAQNNNNNNNRPQKPAHNRPNKPHNNKPNKPKPQKPIGNGNGTANSNGTITMETVSVNGTMVNGNGTSNGTTNPQKPGGGNRPQSPGNGKPGNGKPVGRPSKNPGGKPVNGKPGNGNGSGCLKPPKGNSRMNTCDHFTQSTAVVLGMASFGSCQEGFVFTRITSNLDFIYSTLNHFKS